MIEYSNILYCSDFSEEAEMAFHHAVDFCQRYDAKLHLLHVLHSDTSTCAMWWTSMSNPMKRNG